MTKPTYTFTKPDPELTQSSNRDPLGFEIIWTQLGGRVIPHFSTVSIGATNFGVSLALIWLVDTYLEEHGRFVFSDGQQWRKARDGLLISAESLHAYSALQLNDERRGILGGQKAARRLNSEDGPVVGPFDSEAILVRQLAFGVYGRYRRALASMGLLDDSGHLEDPDRIEAILSSAEALDGLRDAVFSFFDQLRDNTDHRVALTNFHGLEQMASLRRPAVRRHFAPYLCEGADITDKSDRLIARLYEALKLPYEGTADARSIFNGISQSNNLTPHQRQAVEDICRAEELLIRFKALFDQLWTDGIDIEASRSVIDYINEHRQTLTALASRPVFSKIASQRLRQLADVAEEQQPSAFSRALVRDYHRDTIAEYRGNSPWVTFDGEQVAIINNSHSPPADPFEELSWNRSYYLFSLAAFKSDIEEVR